MPANHGRFPSIASAGATRPRNEVLEWRSLVTVAFRCELWPWSYQVLQEYIGQRMRVPEILALFVPEILAG